MCRICHAEDLRYNGSATSTSLTSILRSVLDLSAQESVSARHERGFIMPSIELRFFGPPQIVREGKLLTVQRRKSLALLALPGRHAADVQPRHPGDPLLA